MPSASHPCRPSCGVADFRVCAVPVLAVLPSWFQPLRRTGFVLAVMAVVSFAPTVQGKCGDYVRIAAPAQASSHDPAASPPAPGGPCRGVNCSHPHDSPPLPPAVPAQPETEPAMCCSAAPFVPAAVTPAHVTDWHNAPYPGHPFRLKRPPRS